MADNPTDAEVYYNQVTQPIAYEGASTSYKSGLRGLLNGDVNTLAAREILYLQMRSAHAIRNNGYAKSAFNKYVTKLGAIKVRWDNDLMQELWDEFVDDPNLDGYGTFKNTQAAWNGAVFEKGNAFSRLLIRKNSKARIPLKIQTIPTELWDVTYMGDSVNKKIKYGIQFSDSKPTNYFFRKDFYESFWLGITITGKPTAVSANELLHIFMRDTPGQWIGLPALTSSLVTLYELDELADATVAKQKAAQAIAWIIENTNPYSLTPTGVPITTTDSEGKEKIIFKSSGGNVQYLNKGEKINFYQSTDIGSNLAILIKDQLHKIAASLDLPYHAFSGDTDGLDFSSIRATAIELRTRLEFIHHFMTIPLGVGKVVSRFKELAVLRYPEVEAAKASYQLPRHYGVDELKDTQADLLEVQSGMSTLQAKLDERHLTFDDIISDRAKIAEAGLDNLLYPNGKQTSQIVNTSANTNSSSN